MDIVLKGATPPSIVAGEDYTLDNDNFVVVSSPTDQTPNAISVFTIPDAWTSHGWIHSKYKNGECYVTKADYSLPDGISIMADDTKFLRYHTRKQKGIDGDPGVPVTHLSIYCSRRMEENEFLSKISSIWKLDHTTPCRIAGQAEEYQIVQRDMQTLDPLMQRLHRSIPRLLQINPDQFLLISMMNEIIEECITIDTLLLRISYSKLLFKFIQLYKGGDGTISLSNIATYFDKLEEKYGWIDQRGYHSERKAQ